MRVCLKKEKNNNQANRTSGKNDIFETFVVHEQSVKKQQELVVWSKIICYLFFSKLTHHQFFSPLLVCCSLSDDFNVNNMRKTMKTVMNRLLRSKMSKRKLFDNDFVCWRKKFTGDREMVRKYKESF